MLGWLVPGEKLKVGVDTPKAGPHATAATGRAGESGGSAPAPEPAAPAAAPKSYSPAAAARMVASEGFQPGTQCEFSLDSLDAFDDLIMKHYSVVDKSGSPSGDSASYRATVGCWRGVPCVCIVGCHAYLVPGLPRCFVRPRAEPEVGQTVEVAYKALVWDGATTRATEFMDVASHVFQLGDRSLVPVPPGLHAALAELQPGQSATLVLDPDAGCVPHACYSSSVHCCSELGGPWVTCVSVLPSCPQVC